MRVDTQSTSIRGEIEGDETITESENDNSGISTPKIVKRARTDPPSRKRDICAKTSCLKENTKVVHAIDSAESSNYNQFVCGFCGE